ncbi:MAG: ATP-dependent DNA helicase [Mariprofundaceae bacterium]|nr:ATP-dependent DNA helicase [Mariprofundaceae bacterium]
MLASDCFPFVSVDDSLPLVQQVADDFSLASPLAAHFSNYQPRPQQIQLSQEIATAFATQQVLIAEAETGTGKTLAYLLPALRSGEKILLSTHTRALQDQLMHRDLPAVEQATGLHRSVALLKGRLNYLCPQRLAKFMGSAQLDLWQQRPLLRVHHWAKTTVTGDLNDLPFDPFEKNIGAMVTATADQCIGSACEHWQACPLMKARLKAQKADIVVANHSLLLADAALKSGEFGAVLPEFSAYVLDEAHALPTLASQHFGITLGRMRLITWLNDAQAILEEFGDETALKQEMLAQGRIVLDVWSEHSLDALQQAWRPLLKLIDSRRERSEDVVSLASRGKDLITDMAFLAAPDADFVAWQEGEGDFFRYAAAPIETGPLLAEHLWSRKSAFVLLSATLRLSHSFTHIRERLGLRQDAIEAYHASPFNYAEQALNYLPRHLPDSRSPVARTALLSEMESLLRASRGRAFVLFTAYQNMNSIAPELAQRLPWNVYIQGVDGSRDYILREFRKDTHSILCGTRSFWEGVDVPGETLSLVIIDKMPFAPPSDPLLQARIARCEENGGNGFRDIQLPEAIAVLRQGIGRLIRHADDRGVMAILDSRLYQKSYGREVAYNLPPARITDNIADVRWFFEEG